MEQVQSIISSTKQNSRLVFIDILRAYAILMMLQGHFVDTLLAESYRDTSSTIYYLWAFMRGMTAPIFFTVTGLVFTYLLLKDGRSLQENKRIKKGLKRGFYLVGIAYLLKINFPALLTLYISPWVWSADVLHIIGLALIAIIGIVSLKTYAGGPLFLWMLVAGLASFFIDPFFTQHNWDHLPRFLAHYITNDYGSNFTLVPWLGYAFFGSALACVLRMRPQLCFTHWFPLLIMAFGWTLTLGSARLLVNIYQLTSWSYLEVIFNNNYLFVRLGHVLIAMSLFMWFVPRIKNIPPLISKIGGETLAIYGAHYVLLYGTCLGFGLYHMIGYRSMSPIPCAIGALMFVAVFVLMVKHIEIIRTFYQQQMPLYFYSVYRKSRVIVVRKYRALAQIDWAESIKGLSVLSFLKPKKRGL